MSILAKYVLNKAVDIWFNFSCCIAVSHNIMHTLIKYGGSFYTFSYCFPHSLILLPKHLKISTFSNICPSLCISTFSPFFVYFLHYSFCHTHLHSFLFNWYSASQKTLLYICSFSSHIIIIPSACISVFSCWQQNSGYCSLLC